MTTNQNVGRNGAQTCNSSSYFLINSSTTSSSFSFNSGTNNLSNGLSGNLYLNEIHNNAIYTGTLNCTNFNPSSFFKYQQSFNCNVNGGSTVTILFSTFGLSVGYYRYMCLYNPSNTNTVIQNVYYLALFEIGLDNSGNTYIYNTTFAGGSWNISSVSGGFSINCTYTSSYNNFNLYRMKLF